jgi:hypothetical protein
MEIGKPPPEPDICEILFQVKFVDLKESKDSQKANKNPDWVQLTDFVEKEQLEKDFGGGKNPSFFFFFFFFFWFRPRCFVLIYSF